MLPIEAFLSRARALLGAAAASKSEIRLVIESECGVALPASALEVKGNKLFIRAHPVIKNTLFMKKEKILQTLNKKGVEIVEIQ